MSSISEKYDYSSQPKGYNSFCLLPKLFFIARGLQFNYLHVRRLSQGLI